METIILLCAIAAMLWLARAVCEFFDGEEL